MRFLSFLLFSILIGCTPFRMNTQSGKPEVTIHGVSKDVVFDAIAAEALNNGWTIVSQNNYLMIVSAPPSNARNVMQAIAGTPSPEKYTYYNVSSIDNGVRVVISDIKLVDAPRNYTQNYGITERNAGSLQASLAQLKSQLQPK